MSASRSSIPERRPRTVELPSALFADFRALDALATQHETARNAAIQQRDALVNGFLQGRGINAEPLWKVNITVKGATVLYRPRRV